MLRVALLLWSARKTASAVLWLSSRLSMLFSKQESIVTSEHPFDYANHAGLPPVKATSSDCKLGLLQGKHLRSLLETPSLLFLST